MSDLPLSTSERKELEMFVAASSWLSESPRSARRLRKRVPRSIRFMTGDHLTAAPPSRVGDKGGIGPPGEQLHQRGDGEADEGDGDEGELEGPRVVAGRADRAVEDRPGCGDADRVADLLGGREDARGGAGVARVHPSDDGGDQR